MRAFDQGAYYRVTVSANEVADWKRYWPCSGLPSRSLSFTFDKRNGDLVDTNAPESVDGAALVALSHDAQVYGRKRLRLSREG